MRERESAQATTYVTVCCSSVARVKHTRMSNASRSHRKAHEQATLAIPLRLNNSLRNTLDKRHRRAKPNTRNRLDPTPFQGLSVVGDETKPGLYSVNTPETCP